MILYSDSGFNFLVIHENFKKSFSVENPINSEIILRTKKRNFRHNSCINKRCKRPLNNDVTTLKFFELVRSKFNSVAFPGDA
jgi:hypothetical protein